MKKILKILTVLTLVLSVAFAVASCTAKDLDEDVSIIVTLKAKNEEVRILNITTKKSNLHDALLEYIKVNDTIEYNYSGFGFSVFTNKLWKVEDDNGGFVCVYHNLSDNDLIDSSGFFSPITVDEVEYKASNVGMAELPIQEGAMFYIFYSVYSAA